MKKRSLLLSVVAAFGFTTASIAQVPSYVPSNGLVGWWPFNGNANDESGNGNNGTVNGATLAADRFGNANNAYSFDGVDDNITIENEFNFDFQSNFSICAWIKTDTIFQGQKMIVTKFQNFDDSYGLFYSNNLLSGQLAAGPTQWTIFDGVTEIMSSWQFATLVFSDQIAKLYLNGIEESYITYNQLVFNSQAPVVFGDFYGNNWNTGAIFDGKIDDVGIWGRALSECEIQDLYLSQLGSFSNSSVSVNPTSSAISSNATLTVSTPIQNVQWQSNPGNMGWNNVVNNNTYSGSTNDTLVVSNLQLSNHNQPFRVLACGDTSNVATIQIADTCITNVTVYDTLLTTVTDTLIINTTLSLPAPNNENTIKVYPNPASDHITIDNGNFAAMAGYSIKITNNSGQEVFLNAINQAQFYVDLSTWTGNGLYFVHLIDSQNNTVTVRKIVLQ